MNRMLLRLWKRSDAIEVECRLDFREPLSGSFTFQLACGYQVDRIVDSDGRCLEFESAEKRTIDSPYRADRGCYVVKNALGTQFSIFYSGASRAQHTLFSDDVLAINRASGWYPCPISPGGGVWDAEVFIYPGLDYVVLNAHFLPEENAWYYRPQEDELFIVALKNYRCKRSQGGVIYYYPQDDTDDHIAALCVNSLAGLLPYFESLYGCNTVDEVSIVSLPTSFNAGAYNIDRTIILNRLVFAYGKDTAVSEEPITHLIGHELAHNWCCGAAGNWEDWLNETSAEWSALAYLLENGHTSYVHDVILDYCREEKPEPIRTRDGERPSQVHLKGTLLFYHLYRMYDLAVIKYLLKAFVELREKNTDNWLRRIGKHYPQLIPEIIEGLHAELLGGRL